MLDCVVGRFGIGYPKDLTASKSVKSIVFIFFVKIGIVFLQRSVGSLHHVHFDLLDFLEMLLFLSCDHIDSIFFSCIHLSDEVLRIHTACRLQPLKSLSKLLNRDRSMIPLQPLIPMLLAHSAHLAAHFRIFLTKSLRSKIAYPIVALAFVIISDYDALDLIVKHRYSYNSDIIYQRSKSHAYPKSFTRD
jgi:hypothetical protein